MTYIAYACAIAYASWLVALPGFLAADNSRAAWVQVAGVAWGVTVLALAGAGIVGLLAVGSWQHGLWVALIGGIAVLLGGALSRGTSYLLALLFYRGR